MVIKKINILCSEGIYSFMLCTADTVSTQYWGTVNVHSNDIQSECIKVHPNVECKIEIWKLSPFKKSTHDVPQKNCFLLIQWMIISFQKDLFKTYTKVIGALLENKNHWTLFVSRPNHNILNTPGLHSVGNHSGLNAIELIFLTIDCYLVQTVNK